MKQPELFTSAKSKAKPCCWILLNGGERHGGVRVCGAPAVGAIHKAPYCVAHGERASRMFGPFKLFAPTIWKQPT